MTTRMCTLCDAAPVVSDGKCSLCLKDAAGTEPQPLNHNRRPKTLRGQRTSTPSWVRPRKVSKGAPATGTKTEREPA